MREPSTYDYAVIRVVPRVEREEFINVGVVVSCPEQQFLEARIEFDAARVAALDPTIPLICAGGDAAGPIGKLSPRERFRWLTAPRSTVIQFSPAHTGRCEHPAALLEHLLATMVRVPGRGTADHA